MKWDKVNEKVVCAASCAADEVAIAKKVVMRAPPKTAAKKAMIKRGGKRLLGKNEDSRGTGNKEGGDTEGGKGGDTGGKGGDKEGGKGGDTGGKGGADGKGGDAGGKGGADGKGGAAGGKGGKPPSGKAAQEDRDNKMKTMSKGKMSGKDRMAAIKKMQKAVIVCVPKPDQTKSKIVYKRTDK